MDHPFLAKLWSISCVGVVLGSFTATSRAGTLYETGFETFTTGSDTIAGRDGWTVAPSTVAGFKTNGIDDGLVPSLGKTAYLGYYPPPSAVTSVSVYRRVTPDPVAAGLPVVDFYCVLGLTNSKNKPNKDDFDLRIFNNQTPTLQVLGGLNFDLNDGYVYRYDGVSYSNTGFAVPVDQITEVNMRLNFRTSRWTADIGGVRIVNGQPITAKTTVQMSFGAVAAVWIPRSSFAPGDNWMLLDDWNIVASAEPGVQITTAQKNASGFMLNWPGEAGYLYQVQYLNASGSQWLSTLPDSLFGQGTGDAAYSFLDPSAPPGKRLYRILRTRP
jgi:hypothetical protein